MTHQDTLGLTKNCRGLLLVVYFFWLNRAQKGSLRIKRAHQDLTKNCRGSLVLIFFCAKMSNPKKSESHLVQSSCTPLVIFTHAALMNLFKNHIYNDSKSLISLVCYLYCSIYTIKKCFHIATNFCLLSHLYKFTSNF